MDKPIAFDTEQLLAQVPWIRRLATRVAGDSHLAEDLAQDALVVALGGRRVAGAEALSEPAALRRWLAAVVQNLGRTRRRSERRRAAREAAMAEQGLSPSAYEVVERFATQGRLVRALLELDEPYRSTLLLRYFDSLTQREIAARTGVPASTVGTRLAEGLRRLRRKVRGRESWLASLAALALGRDGARAATVCTGAMFMTIRAKSILVGTVVLAVFLVARVFVPAAPSPQAMGPESPPAGVADPGLLEGEPVPERVALESTAESSRVPGFAEIPAHAGLAFGTVHGRVVDLTATPLVGVEVVCGRPTVVGTVEHGRVSSPSLRTARTGADGLFAIEGALPMEFTVRDTRYATVFKGVAQAVGDDEVLVVVGRRICLAGAVVDEAGVPLSGVAISVLGDATLRGLDLGSSALVIPERRSDGSGAFSFDQVAAVGGAEVHFRAPGFATRVRPVPLDGDPAMHVVLSRDREARYTITGLVVHEDGRPAMGAYVTTGVMAIRSDERGRFVLDCEPWLSRVDRKAPTELTAILPGHRPARRILPSVREVEEEGWPERIVLELGGAPMEIDGVVVDEQGLPVAGLLVEPADMTRFGLIQSEGMPALYGVPTTQELLAGGRVAYTDEDGRFVVGGLLERNYTLRVLERKSLQVVVTEGIPAGQRGLRIVFDRRRLGTLAGRIVDRHGLGIGGVRIAVSGKRIGELVIGRSAETGEDGAFRLTGVTTEPEFLRLEGKAIVPELFRELSGDDDLGALVLPVGRRCRVQFDWGDWPVAGDELRVVDGLGEPLMMMRVTASGIGERPALFSKRGVSDVVLVSDAAAQAVVTREGQEVVRLRLELRADELNVLRL